ncbi:hypothetical protein D3C77_60770 [compost metagenome]
MLTATEALEQAGTAQTEERSANGAVCGWQQQGLAVLEQLDEDAARTDHQGQSEVVFALDADNQLGKRRTGHGLEQHLVKRY